MSKLALVAIAIGIMVLGFALIMKPGFVAEKLQRFYSEYPLVRYFGSKQLRSRSSYLVLLGVTIVVLGFLALLGALGKI
jgi:hypothetical protein